MELCDEIIRRKWSIRNLQSTCPSKMSVENDPWEIFDKNVGGNDLGKFTTQISVSNKSWEFCDRISVRNDPCEISTDISISNF